MNEAWKHESPVLIAMKGHPGTGKSTLAHYLALALKCPLIDKDDVRDSTSTLQHSFSLNIDTALLNDLSYDVLWKIASTQLRLGLNVIIDSPLSRPTHLHRLIHLASSHGAHLMIVECKPKDEAEWRRRLELRGKADGASWHKPSTWLDLQKLLEGYGGCSDYDVGDVPKLVVDTTAPVAVEELLSNVLHFIVDNHPTLGDVSTNICVSDNVCANV